MDTATDPFQLLIDAMLAHGSQEGKALLEESVGSLANNVVLDRGALLNFVTVAADMLDISLEVFGGMTDLSDRVEFVHECKRGWASQSALFNEIDSIFEGYEND